MMTRCESNLFENERLKKNLIKDVYNRIDLDRVRLKLKDSFSFLIHRVTEYNVITECPRINMKRMIRTIFDISIFQLCT